MKKLVLSSHPDIIIQEALNPAHLYWKWSSDEYVKIDRLQRGLPAELIVGESLMRAGLASQHLIMNHEINEQTHHGDWTITLVDKNGVIRIVTLDVKNGGFVSSSIINRYFPNEHWILCNAGQNNYWFAFRINEKSKAVLSKIPTETKDHVPGYYALFKYMRQECPEDLITPDGKSPEGYEMLGCAIKLIPQVQLDFMDIYGWVSGDESKERTEYILRQREPYFDSLNL